MKQTENCMWGMGTNEHYYKIVQIPTVPYNTRLHTTLHKIVQKIFYVQTQQQQR